MKKISLFLLVLGFSLSAMAVLSPFQPKDEQLVSKDVINLSKGGSIIGNSLGKARSEALGVDGYNQRRCFRATYDPTVDGGSSATGTFSLGITIPALSVITEAYAYVETAMASASSGTLAFECEDSENLLAAVTDTSASGSIVDFIPRSASGSVSWVKDIAADCNLSVVSASATTESGKWIVHGCYQVQE